MDYDESKELRCPGCRKEVNNQDIPKHIEQCSKYAPTVWKRINTIDKSVPLSDLKFLKWQLQMSSDHIAKFISQGDSANKKKNEVGRNSSIYDDFDDQLQKRKNLKKKTSDKMREDGGIDFDISAYNSRIVVCKNCERKYYENIDREILFYVYDCWHVFCLPCVNKYIDLEFVNVGGSGMLKCLNDTCHKILDEDQLRGLLGNEKFETLQNKAIRKMCNISQCFKCKQQFEFVEGNFKDAPKKDPTGKDVGIEQAKDYAINRFICPKADCKTEQCKSCQANPYHLGMTCKEFKARSLLKKCRYCNQPLTEKNASLNKIKALADICNSKECNQSGKGACQKINNKCKHPCYGYKGEKECLPCLHQNCAKQHPQLNGVNGDEYCAVCYVEPLSAAPCIRSSCGHIFHVKCLKKRFQIKWLTPRILFNFCLCPLCKKWIQVQPQSQLYKHAEDNKLLFQKIEKMSLQRLKFQQLQKSDEKLTNKSSSYYGKPLQYAMAIYAYFMCFKCKNPYFGGRKNCADAMNEGQNAGGVFKQQQLICANCCEIPIEDCPKHGKDFIEFKCKFCCNTAQWFCWGNTHFCEPCHKRQCNGDYVSKYTKDQLPKCQGPGKCHVGGNHNGNGEQKMLGCAICRSYKQNNKGF